MTRQRWARRLPQVTVEVECGRATHAVLLCRGKIVLADHSLAAEAVAAALGAAPPACFEVYRSWRAREQWEIALEPRGPGLHQLYRRPPLPAGLATPLERGVARGWERRAARGDRAAEDTLERAVRAKAEPKLAAAFAAAVRRFGGGPIERLELSVGAGPWVWGEITPTSSSLVLRVAPDWLRTVGLAWGRAGPEGDAFLAAARPCPVALEWRSRAGGTGWSARLVAAT